ncbi:SPOSA6832_04431 [Sporobolomyces salmonicolor]|uniref:SPOSA6832_04431-mRNA-1:cds n=1 Tax=Sporidiobolus salmonicolor TaxID=5005 RepID=A0A0D6ERK8_SPOSA|nr:SPOSA6832_04431 [Sporobolomyces salmonicolor]
MAPITNKKTIFAEVPSGVPEPGKTLKLVEDKIDLEAELKEGQILVKTLSLSLDPYLRGRMRPAGTKSYVPPFELGQPIANFGTGEARPVPHLSPDDRQLTALSPQVLKSANASIKQGQHVYGSFPFAEYNVFSKEEASRLRILENKEGLPWTTWVGAAGMPGQTAWHGLRAIGKPQKGETIFVSGAMGAVGQMVISIAHKLGLKVIASAGSDEKVELLKKEFKVEVAFNYKTVDTEKILSENPFQIYWDNVAGPTFEAVLNTIEPRGRIIGCVAKQHSNDYNGQPYGIKNIFQVVSKELLYQGFIVLNHPIEAFYDEVPKWIASGEVTKPKEHIYKGLDNGESFNDLFTGANFGKAVISLE